MAVSAPNAIRCIGGRQGVRVQILGRIRASRKLMRTGAHADLVFLRREDLR